MLYDQTAPKHSTGWDEADSGDSGDSVFNIKSRQIHWDLAGETKHKPTIQLTLSKLSTHPSIRHPEAKAMSIFLKHGPLSPHLKMCL